MTAMPAIFVSHGSPMFAVDPGLLGPKLRTAGEKLAGIRAVLVVSAHWETRDVRVSTAQKPTTIHDFGGFPSYLYALTYPASGHPEIAREAARLLALAGHKVTLDQSQGLDHGAWVPLLHLLPNANVPVFQVSIPNDLTASDAIKFGQALAPLREQGVLIVGSGSMTHNLRDVFSDISDPEYAQEFTEWVESAVQRRDVESLIDYRHLAPHAQRAHPSEEHFLPLLISVGASGDGDQVKILDGGITYNVLAMNAILFTPGGRNTNHG